MAWLLNTILMKAMQEALMSLLGKLPWGVIMERLLSRLIVAGLRNLASRTTNTLDDETVEDVINVLRRTDLPEIK